MKLHPFAHIADLYLYGINNTSSSRPITWLFFQLGECMYWHLLDSPIAPPSELQECLQTEIKQIQLVLWQFFIAFLY